MNEMAAPIKEVAPRPPRRRPVTLGPIGLPEAIALALSLLLVLAAALAYFFVWQPNIAELERLQKQRETSTKELAQIKAQRATGATSQQQVEQIAQSVVGFERNFLTRRETGRLALYKLLNDLMKRNGVKNSSGPTYAPLEPLKPEEQTRRASGGSKGNDRWQSIYPGLNVNVTVEGKYADLRRFVRDLEATGQFIVINTVELEGGRNQDKDNPANANAAPLAQPTPELSDDQRRGERVNLRLDLAAYFQRDNLSELTAASKP